MGRRRHRWSPGWGGASDEPAAPLITPDGRYLVVRGRLWRRTDPRLSAGERERWQRELGSARAAKGAARRRGDDRAAAAARDRVDTAKRALGERGPVWWDDGAPDLTRHLAKNTTYAAWYGSHQGRSPG